MNKPLNPHVEKVCQPGKLECCRYLMMGGDGWECAKLTSLKALLDSRVAAGTIRAVGDNCEGKDQQFLNSERS